MAEPFGEDMHRDFAALGICPGCLVGIAGGGSVSRFDDETKVCTACGAFEALVLARGGTLEAPGFEFTGGRARGAKPAP